MPRTALLAPSVLLSLLLLLLPTVGKGQPPYESNSKLPAIPLVEGELQARIIYPEPGHSRPGVKRNFIFGSTGNGKATVTVNGKKVNVAPNGAFLGFLPVPKKTYVVIATLDGLSDTTTFTYSDPEEVTSVKMVRDLKEEAVFGEVTFGADTLASGSGIAYGAPTKTANREWFFPIGARFPVLEQNGEHLRIELGGRKVWVEREYVTTSSASPEEHDLGVEIDLHDADGWVDLRIPVAHAPFRIDTKEKSITMTFYQVSSYELEKRLRDSRSATWQVTNLPNLIVRNYTWSAVDKKNTATLKVDLRRPLWGFKVFYDDVGEVVLRIRRPNAISSENPLQGLVVMVDAGHPPRGASGPNRVDRG